MVWCKCDGGKDSESDCEGKKSISFLAFYLYFHDLCNLFGPDNVAQELYNHTEYQTEHEK